MFSLTSLVAVTKKNNVGNCEDGIIKNFKIMVVTVNSYYSQSRVLNEGSIMQRVHYRKSHFRHLVLRLLEYRVYMLSVPFHVSGVVIL